MGTDVNQVGRVRKDRLYPGCPFHAGRWRLQISPLDCVPSPRERVLVGSDQESENRGAAAGA
jgi:hypothetical protein